MVAYTAGGARSAPAPAHPRRSARRCRETPGCQPPRRPFTSEPASGVGRQPRGQAQADARGAARDQHRGLLHGRPVPAEGAALLKRAGRGVPPAPCCVCCPISRPRRRGAGAAAAITAAFPPRRRLRGSPGVGTSPSSSPSRAMPCCAMPCHAMPCRAMPCHAMLYHAMPGVPAVGSPW